MRNKLYWGDPLDAAAQRDLDEAEEEVDEWEVGLRMADDLWDDKAACDSGQLAGG